MPVSMGEASGKLTLDAKGFFESIKSAKGALSEFNKSMDSTKSTLSKTESEMKKSGEEFDGYGNKAKGAGSKLDGLKEKAKTLGTEVKSSGDKVKIYGNTMTTAGTKAEGANTKVKDFGIKIKDVATKIKNSLPSVEQLGKKFESVGNTIKAAGTKLKTASSKLTTASTAATAGLGISVKNATDFDTKMRKVQATSGASTKEMEKLRAVAKKMGAETKFSASDAADALNYMAMAGWKTDQMIKGLPGIMDLAAASGEDLATTSDIVTDALTAFGMKAEDSSDFADILAKAASNANTNVSMMGETFKYVAPVAGTFGYSAKDVAVAIGLMANSGIKASQAGTSLRSSLSKMAKPTKDAWTAMQQYGIVTTKTTKAVNEDFVKAQKQVEKNQSKATKAQLSYNAAVEKYGKNSTQAKKKLIDLKDAQSELTTSQKALASMQKTSTKQEAEYNDLMFDSKGNAKSFKEVVDRLRESFKKLTPEQQSQAAATIFGQESMAGMLAIINASDEDYQKLTKSIDKSSGAAKKMSKIQMSGLGGQITQLKSKLEGLSISIGEKVIPIISPLVDKISELVDKFGKLDEKTQKMIVYGGMAVAVASPVLRVLGTIVSSIGTLILTIGKIPGALLKIKSTKAFTFLSTQFSKIPGAASKAVGGIKSAFTTSVTALKAPVTMSFGTLGAAVAAGIGGWTIGTWIYNHFGKEIDGVLHPIFEKIQGFVEGWMPFWEKLGGKVYDKMHSGFDSYMKFFEGIGEDIYDWVHDKANKLSTGFKDFTRKVKNTIKSGFNTYKTTFEKFGENIYDWVHDKSNQKSSGFSDFVTNVKSAVNRGFTHWRKTFEGFGEDVYDWIHDPANDKTGGFKDFVENIVDTIKNAFQSYKKTFEGFGEDIYDWIHGGAEGDDDEFVKNLQSVGPSYTPGKSHAMGLDYVPYDGYNAILHKGERVLTKQENVQYTNNKYSGGDTFIFNSPKAINEFEAARQMKRMKRELAEGF